MTFLRITAPHFVAGVSVGVLAAPIIGYMRGWSEEKIREYCKRKGWQVEEPTLTHQRYAAAK